MAPQLLLFAVLGAITPALAQAVGDLTTITTDLFVMQTPAPDAGGPPILVTFAGVGGAEAPYSISYEVDCPVNGGTQTLSPPSPPCDYLHNALVQIGTGGMTLDVTRRSTILDNSAQTYITVTGSASCRFEGTGPTAAVCEGHLTSLPTTMSVSESVTRSESTAVTETLSTSIADIAHHTIRIPVTGVNIPTQTSSARKLSTQQATLAGVVAIIGGIAML
ncbi:hypothetical protein MFIFM68171_08233 [Madurella fahalii]|uniref:Uncharacterized protein n=1 Tax=Madurella fahalii TaxID=1157608 RepID=A0ABQ0GJS9_9PEZI